MRFQAGTTISFTLAKKNHTHSQTKVSYLERDLRSTWLPYVIQICGVPLASLTDCGTVLALPPVESRS